MMNAHAEKLDIRQWIGGLKDETTLRMLKELKEKSASNQNDWWNSITAEERMSIERGIADSENGRLTPHSEIRKKYVKWL